MKYQTSTQQETNLIKELTMLRLGKIKKNVYRKAVLVHARDAIRCPIQSSEALLSL